MSVIIEERLDGKLIAVGGASRHGKTHWVKQQIKKAKRLLVFDIRGEYMDENMDVVARSIRDLAAVLSASGKNKQRITFWGNVEDFSAWCELAYAWAQLFPCVIVAEETSDVTSPGKAPAAYGELMRKIMYYGGHLYGITQRPQESDKTIWGNATLKHCHGFVTPSDCEYIARLFGCETSVVSELQKYDFIEQAIGEKIIETSKTFR